jgi:hypothetical protein
MIVNPLASRCRRRSVISFPLFFLVAVLMV